MSAREALATLVIACVAIVVGVAMAVDIAWALIIGGVLLLIVTVLLYDSQANQRRAIARRAGRDGL